MKKLLTLMLAAGMTLAAANGAQAVDVKVSGTYDFSFSGSDNLNGDNSFMSDSDYRHNTGRELNQHHFDVYQRLRLGMDFVMSEQLAAFYQAQIGIFNWGGSYKGASKMENDGGAARHPRHQHHHPPRLPRLDDSFRPTFMSAWASRKCCFPTTWPAAPFSTIPPPACSFPLP